MDFPQGTMSGTDSYGATRWEVHQEGKSEPFNVDQIEEVTSPLSSYAIARHFPVLTSGKLLPGVFRRRRKGLLVWHLCVCA